MLKKPKIPSTAIAEMKEKMRELIKKQKSNNSMII